MHEHGAPAVGAPGESVPLRGALRGHWTSLSASEATFGCGACTGSTMSWQFHGFFPNKRQEKQSVSTVLGVARGCLLGGFSGSSRVHTV